MRIAAVCRYPVKSMLGEAVEEVRLEPTGVEGDRGLAVIDAETGFVATAKHPRLWRALLQYFATTEADQVWIRSPAGWAVPAEDPAVEDLLSTALGRPVRISNRRPAGAAVERPSPEDILEHGVESPVEVATLEIGQGAPGFTFVDYAPVHLITSTTVEGIGTEWLRYRPNVVIHTPPGTPAFVENDWVGRELAIGPEALLRVILPTPRCAVPTLEHGALGRAPEAVRATMIRNRIDVPGFGRLPCAGVYAEVVRPGVVRSGDEVVLV